MNRKSTGGSKFLSFLPQSFKRNRETSQQGEPSTQREPPSGTPPHSSTPPPAGDKAVADPSYAADKPAASPSLSLSSGTERPSASLSANPSSAAQDPLVGTSADPPNEAATNTETAEPSALHHPPQDAEPVLDDGPSPQKPGGPVSSSVQTDMSLNVGLPPPPSAPISDTKPPPKLPAYKPLLATPEERAKSLWALAYGRLQERLSDEEVFDWLAICGLNVGSSRGSVNVHDDEMITHFRLELVVGALRVADLERQSQLKRDKAEKSTEEEGGNKAEEKKEEDGQTPKQIMGAALRARPHGSFAWAASYITLQSLFDAPPPQHEDGYSQIISVINKTEWYVDLFKLVFWVDQQKAPPSFAINALVALNEAILMYHFRAAMQVAEQPDQICLDRETRDIEARMDVLIATFDRLDIQLQVSALLKTAYTEDATGLPQLLARLHVDQGQMRKSNVKNSHILEPFFALASNTPAYKEFVQWDGEHDRRILWISGSPGVGKTMLLRAVVQKLHAKPEGTIGTAPKHVASFFCDSAKQQQGDALSVVKGLIYNVLLSQPDLSYHFEKMFSSEYSGPTSNQREDFDAPGDFAAMSMLLCRIVQDELFQATYFVLDGVDELDAATTNADPDPVPHAQDRLGNEGDLVQLLRLVATTIELSSNVKWALSVDHERCACELDTVAEELQLRLDLDKGLEGVAQIAREYAADSVAKISHAAGYNVHIRNSLLKTLDTAPSNILWTNMALDIVRESTTPWNASLVLGRLAKDAPSVGSLYTSRRNAIRELARDDVAYCDNVLSIAAAAYRPLVVSELVAISDLPPAVELDVIVKTLLPSFLAISEGTVHFTHLSARDFIKHDMKGQIRDVHSKIAKRCLTLVLQRLNCGCASAHADFDNIGSGDNGVPRAGVDYATAMWIRHLSEPGSKDDPKAVALAVHLLTVHLVEWLALLGPRNTVLEGLDMMRRLHATIAAGTQPQQMPRAGHDDFHVPVSNTPQIFREVITFMHIFQHWVRSKEDHMERWTDEATSELNNMLLFAADLPTLRKILVPTRFPWLEAPPTIDSKGASASCLHVIHHNDWVRGCCFSPDGRLVASASDDRYVRIWDTQTGNLQHCFDGFEGYVRNAIMLRSPALNGRVLLAALDYRTIKTWDVVSGKCIFTLSNLPTRAQNIALSPSANKLAAATDGGLFVWEDLSDPVEISGGVQYTEENSRCVKFSPDGNFIASTDGPKIMIWNARASKEVLYTLPVPRKRRRESQQSQADAPSRSEDEPEESHEGGGASESNETDVNGINQENGQGGDDATPGAKASTEVNTETGSNSDEEGDKESEAASGHSSSIDGLAFSPDSTFLVSGSDDRTARVWDLRTRKTVAIFDFHVRYVNCVSFSPDGSCIATGSSDERIAIWKHKSPGNWGSGEKRIRPDRILYGNTSSIWNLAFSPVNPSLLASGPSDGGLRVWDIDIDTINAIDTTTNGAADTVQMEGHRTGVCCVAISADGSMLASASFDGVVCIWDGKTGVQLRAADKEERHTAQVLMMAFSPDGALLVTTSINGVVFVWNVAGSAETPQTQLAPSLRFEHSDWVRDASFDPAGQFVATGCDDHIVRVFDVSGARTDTHIGDHQVLPGRDADVNGGWPAPSGSNDSGGPVIVTPSKSFDKHSRYLYGVAFSADGKHLASGGDDRHVRIWDLKSDGAEPEHEGEEVDSAIRGVAFADNDSKVVSVSRDGSIAVWTWGGSSGRLRYTIVKKMWDDHIAPFRKMRFDPKYPGVIFTEHGPTCADLDEVDKKKKGDDEDEEEPDKAGEVADDRASSLSGPAGRWHLPPGAVHEASVQWNDHVIDLPARFSVTGEPFSWRVQGRMILAGSENGQVLLFRFKEDANPKPKAGETGRPRV